VDFSLKVTWCCAVHRGHHPKFRDLVGRRYIALEQGVGPPGQRLVSGGRSPLAQTTRPVTVPVTLGAAGTPDRC